MDSKHTPGPWIACFSIACNSVTGFHIASNEFGSLHPVVEYSRPLNMKNRPSEEIKANARLIESSPDLLAALQNLLNGTETGAITSDHDETLANSVKQARAAIAKAEGRNA